MGLCFHSETIVSHVFRNNLSIKSKEQQRKCIKIFHSAYKGFLLDFFMGCSQGGKGAGFRAGSEDDTYDKEGKRMFHVRGTSDMNAKAIQVSHHSLFHRLRSFWSTPRIVCCSFRWTRVTKAFGTRLCTSNQPYRMPCIHAMWSNIRGILTPDATIVNQAFMSGM